MDLRLLKAAQLGDVARLKELLKEDPLILEKSALAPTAETPLHIAALVGKVDFVHEIISRKPSFSRKLNQYGFSPLHIAVAEGYGDVVQELLNFRNKDDVVTPRENSSRLCLLGDKRGLIPLHYAAIKGEVSIIEELLRHCPESLKERATREQTVLHLAVKNCQFDAFKTLLDKFKDDDVKNFVDAEDKDGNKIHQMAVASKQLQVLEHLEWHAKLCIIPMEIISGDDLAEGNVDVAMPQATHPQEKATETEPRQPKKQDRSEQTQEENMMLVAASVIATVTFQGISPPEAIFRGGMDLGKNCTLTSVLSPKESCPNAIRYFLLSMVFNTSGFFASLLLLSVFRNSLLGPVMFGTAISCMLITYMLQTVAMYPTSNFLVIHIYGFVAPFVFLYVFLIIVTYLGLVRKYRKLKKRMGKMGDKLVTLRPSVLMKMLLDTPD